MKWRIQSRGRFFDAGESAVVYFDSRSGDTHLLSDFAAYILQQFSDQTLTTNELADRVSPSVDPEELPDLAGSVASILDELAALDILEKQE